MRRWIVVATVAGASSASASVSLLASGLDLPPALAWLVDLTVHWQWLYAVVAIAAASAHTWMRLSTSWLSWSCASLCGICLLQAAPAAPTGGNVPQSGRTLSIASANVFYGNEDLTRLVQWLNTEAPDIVLLQELSPAGASQIARLSGYPHRLGMDGAQPYGVAVLSRHPFAAVETVDWPGERPGHRLSYRVTLKWTDRHIWLGAVHLSAPTSPSYLQLRESLLAATTSAAVLAGKPALVGGDMNATPWAAGMRRAADRGLRRATSLAPTWPAFVGFTPAIPIDQILVSSHWRVTDSARGPAVGSDHLPVIVRLRLDD